MSRPLKSSMGASLAFFAGLLLACLPLQAQLNPQLQNSPTDFLNLYQQANNVKPPPEIVTVFDFSGSMSALMFHPLYVNLDRPDSTTHNNMTFVLSGSAGSRKVTATIKGSTVGTLTSTILVRPDGSQVTETMAGTVSPTGKLAGDANGAADVRNWLRAASHVRFKYTGVSPNRTVDIPIPWKITDHTSHGNPLSSMYLTDQQVKINPDGTTTTYGSSSPTVEVDLCYQIGGTTGSYIFSTSSADTSLLSTSTALTSTTLTYGPATGNGTGMYTNAYIDWLFLGKYGTGQPYAGQYIVFDATTTGLAGGQTSTTDPNADWGRGYGYGPGSNLTSPYTATSTITASTIQVPRFDGSGVYTGYITNFATANVVPAYTRCQAVKRAAIQAWIQNQGNVLWAFRFLDTVTEATSPSQTKIDNNSATTMNVSSGTPPTVPTTQKNGSDSGWTILNNSAAQGNQAANGNSVNGMKRIASLFPNNGTPLTYAVANALAQFNDPNNVFSTAETGAAAPSACMNHFLIVFTDGVDNNNSNNVNPNGTTPYIDYVSGVPTALNALAGNQYVLGNNSSINTTGSYWNIFTFAGMAAHLTDSNLGSLSNPNMGHTTVAQPVAGTSDVPSKFLPFAIKNRGSVDFGSYGHRITTMTVGVSLGGYYTDPTSITSSPKRNLFLAAVVGDVQTTSGAYSTFHAFVPPVRNADGTYTYNDWLPNPIDKGDYPAVGLRNPGATYFFDGSDPEALATDLQYALLAALGSPNINSTVPPNIPFIGTSFSNEIYMGQFVPSAGQGVLWGGDLLAFSTKIVNNQVVILDNNTANAAKSFDSSTAVWSASSVLSNTAAFPWTGRKLYTRIPVNATTISATTASNASNPSHLISADSEPGLSPFTCTSTSTDTNYTANIIGLKNFVGTNPVTHGTALSDATKQKTIQLVSGGDFNGPLDGTGTPKSNRLNIMGDIIGSNPAALEYKFSDVTALSGFPSGLSGAGNRFRLILAGTNQGWLHAFGEVTQTVTKVDIDNKTQTLVSGKIQELWAFLPTDFLGDLDYLITPNNIHRFMVDGASTIYFLDLPSTSAGGSGDGVVEITTAPGPERAVVIFGLGKGGRSYYAIDIHNPLTPKLLWSIVPDEATYFPSSRLPALGGPSLATVKTILTNMGFSTCPPALGRVKFNGVMRDVVFFGGGYSNTAVEHNFPTYPNPPAAQQTPLGRSVLAVDVYTGQVLAAVDLSPANHTTPAIASGPIAAGLVPFEFFLNSGMAQRAYFLDFAGGLWSWGSKETVTSATVPSAPAYVGYRMDTSDLAYWTTDSGTGGTARSFSNGSNAGIRKVAQDGSGSNNAVYSSLPAPFLAGSFPGMGKVTTGNPTPAAPAAVGVAMLSGDRNNPLDYSGGYGTTPTDFRMTVVFDRQDSRAWSLDTAAGADTGIADARLMNFSAQISPTAAAITPGNASYYLAPAVSGVPDLTNTKFGYYINLPTPNGGFIPKGLNMPAVVAGSLFYSYFTPTAADPCTGGTGTTYTNLLCSVLNPTLKDVAGNACQSGQAPSWVGVASSLMTYGTAGVIQGGAVANTPTSSNPSATAMSIKTLLGQQQTRHPKVRTWRTIH